MMWALAALSSIELLVVHLLVALRWPMIGWPLSLLSAAGLVWVVALIRSFSRRPHRLCEGVLHLYAGSLRHLVIPTANIARISADWEAGAHKGADAINLALIAHPNRMIELAEPLGRRRRILIRLDDPSAFDAALARG